MQEDVESNMIAVWNMEFHEYISNVRDDGECVKKRKKSKRIRNTKSLKRNKGREKHIAFNGRKSNS